MLCVKKVSSKELSDLIEKYFFLNKNLSGQLVSNQVSENECSFGIFDKDQMIGFVVFFAEKLNEIFEKSIFQIKAFFVKDCYHGQGVEWNLLVHAEAFLRQENRSIVWLDPQIYDSKTYQRNGYVLNLK